MTTLYCETCETEALQDDPRAIADTCDSCQDDGQDDGQAGPITTMRDLIDSGTVLR